MTTKIQEIQLPPDSLTMIHPTEILQHGPSKLYVDDFLWYSSKHGAISSYSPRFADVKDHFGVFRGVDQVESFAQGTAVAACTLLESKKQNLSLKELQRRWNVAFLGIEQVRLHTFLRPDDLFISVGQIVFYRFRQMVMTGKTYRVPPGFNVKAYFSNYSEESFLNYQLPEGFELVGEIEQLKVMALPNKKFIGESIQQ